MNIFEPFLYWFAGMWLVWLFYLASMNLKRARDKGLLMKGTFVYSLGMGTVVIPGLALNWLLNQTFNRLMFLELRTPPLEMTTARLKRHKKEGGWRAKLADWYCSNLLDKFDPDGEHC